MKINANFYTIGEDTPIFTMYELSAIPFKVGDEINLDVEDLFPIDYSGYKEEIRIKMVENNTELRNQFDRKTIKIVSRRHYARYNNLRAGTMTIEYHCEILPDK